MVLPVLRYKAEASGVGGLRVSRGVYKDLENEIHRTFEEYVIAKPGSYATTPLNKTISILARAPGCGRNLNDSVSLNSVFW